MSRNPSDEIPFDQNALSTRERLPQDDLATRDTNSGDDSESPAQTDPPTNTAEPPVISTD